MNVWYCFILWLVRLRVWLNMLPHRDVPFSDVAVLPRDPDDPLSWVRVRIWLDLVPHQFKTTPQGHLIVIRCEKIGCQGTIRGVVRAAKHDLMPVIPEASEYPKVNRDGSLVWSRTPCEVTA